MTPYLVLVLALGCIGCVNSEDGYPNKKELGDIFKKMDADGDEMVSFDELVTHLVKQATKPGSANLEIAKQIFPNYDKNKDDFITFEEFMQPEHDEL
ncbi:uncharacterized protein LOC134699885 [Mytilus trossulus]|uniref:uncharacterized protein LOC134699885 n=1 Tax=Mytilus trossulus TaxID=6551 RepID=UPI00300606E1